MENRLIDMGILRKRVETLLRVGTDNLTLVETIKLLCDRVEELESGKPTWMDNE